MSSDPLDHLEGDKLITEEINKELNREDYYNVDGESNSRFTAINPEQGGSPKKYLNFVNQDEERKESVDMERGSLIHKYIENPEAFKVQQSDKPADKLGEVADMIAANIGTNFLLSGRIEPATDKELEPYVLDACRTIGWNSRYGDDAIIKNAMPAIKPYVLEHLEFDTTGKIAMTKKTKEIVENCKLSIENHDRASEHLFRQEASGINVFKEVNIYWVVPDINNNSEFRCKAKPDNFTLDYNRKAIILDDLKTGSFSVTNFDGTFKYRRIYRQLAWYKKAIIEFIRQNKLIPESELSSWSWEYYIVAVETKDEFRTAIFQVSDLWIFKGRNEYESLLSRISFHRQHAFDRPMEEYMNNGYMILKNPED